jgi:uncharacterized phiE125 gp8 family phage protein
MTENNIIHSVKLVETGSEPVTVEEVKSHFNIDFVNHDAQVDIFRKAARKRIENATGLAFVEKEVTLVATLFGNYSLELPVSPVKTFTHIKPINGDGVVGDALVAGDTYVRFGANGEQITTSSNGLFEIKYVALMAPVPSDIRLAIMAQASYFYYNRGEWDEESKGICLLAESLISQYIRYFV